MPHLILTHQLEATNTNRTHPEYELTTHVLSIAHMDITPMIYLGSFDTKIIYKKSTICNHPNLGIAQLLCSCPLLYHKIEIFLSGNNPPNGRMMQALPTPNPHPTLPITLGTHIVMSLIPPTIGEKESTQGLHISLLDLYLKCPLLLPSKGELGPVRKIPPLTKHGHQHPMPTVATPAITPYGKVVLMITIIPTHLNMTHLLGSHTILMCKGLMPLMTMSHMSSPSMLEHLLLYHTTCIDNHLHQGLLHQSQSHKIDVDVTMSDPLPLCPNYTPTRLHPRTRKPPNIIICV